MLSGLRGHVVRVLGSFSVASSVALVLPTRAQSGTGLLGPRLLPESRHAPRGVGQGRLVGVAALDDQCRPREHAREQQDARAGQVGAADSWPLDGLIAFHPPSSARIPQ